MADRSSGGVRNIRAMFEARADAEPPSRSRSPAGSEFSEHSRPRSKVRASFVSVEGKSGQLGSRGKDMDGTMSEGGDGGQTLSTTPDPRVADANGAAIGRSPSLGRVHEEDVAKEEAAKGRDPAQTSVGPTDENDVAADKPKLKSVTSPVKDAARAVGSKASELKSKVEAKATSVKSSAKPGGSSSVTAPKASAPKDSSKSATGGSTTKAEASKSGVLPSRSNRLSTASTKATPAASKPTTSRPTIAATRADGSKKEGITSVGGFVKPPPKSPTKPVQLPAGAKASTTSSSAKTGRQSLAGDSSSRTSAVGVPRNTSARTSTVGVARTSRASLGAQPRATSTTATKSAPTSTDAARKVSGPTSSRSSGVGVATKTPVPSKAPATKPTPASSIAKPGTTRAIPSTSSTSKPAAAKPGTAKSAATKPVGTKPAATKPTGSQSTASKPAISKPIASKASASKPGTATAAKKDSVGTKPAVARAIGAKAAADKVAHAKQSTVEITGKPLKEPVAQEQATESEPPTGEPPLAPATKEAIAPSAPAEPEHGGEVEDSQDHQAPAPEVEGSFPERKPSKSEATDFAQTKDLEPTPPVNLSAPVEDEIASPSVVEPAIDDTPDATVEEALVSSVQEPEHVPELAPEPESIAKDVPSAMASEEPELEPELEPEPEVAVEQVVEPPAELEPEPETESAFEPEDAPLIPPTQELKLEPVPVTEPEIPPPAAALPIEPEPALTTETLETVAPEAPTQPQLDDTTVDAPALEAALAPPDSAVAEALAEAPPVPSGPTPSVDFVKQQAAELEMAANELAQIDSAAPAQAPELATSPIRPALKREPSGASGRSGASRPSLHREASIDLHLPEAAKPSEPTEEEIADLRRQSIAAEEMVAPPKLVPQDSVPEEAAAVEDDVVDDSQKENVPAVLPEETKDVSAQDQTQEGGEDLLVDL